MSYYTEPLPTYRCKCGRAATLALKSSGTVTYGYYCRRCGEREAKVRNAEEKQLRDGQGHGRASE